MDAWNYVLRPTLADYKGDAYFLFHTEGAQWVLADVSMGAALRQCRSGCSLEDAIDGLRSGTVRN